jgi:pullulanase/glycogen debranching enzyme
MTRLKAIAALTLACAGLAPRMPARADINEMQLGAPISEDGTTVNFAVYSHNATHIQLCLFASPQGANAILTRDMEINIRLGAGSLGDSLDQGERMRATSSVVDARSTWQKCAGSRVEYQRYPSAKKSSYQWPTARNGSGVMP